MAAVGSVPVRAGGDAQIYNAAVHRRRHRHDLRFVWSVGIDPDLLQSVHGALIFGLGGDVVGLRLLQVFERRAADFRELRFACAGLERECKQDLGPVVIRIGGAKVRRIDHHQRLTRLHPFAELYLELGHAAGNRRVDLDEMRGVGLDDRRQDEVALNVLRCDRTDCERGAQRRTLGHRNTIARANERANGFDNHRRRLGIAGGVGKKTVAAGPGQHAKQKQHDNLGAW